MKANPDNCAIISFPVLDNGDEYQIVCEAPCFTLQKRIPVKRKDGSIEYVWRESGYFSSVEQCCKRILRELRPYTNSTIEEYIKLFQDVKNELINGVRRRS